MNPSFDVVIAGGGAAGLALALALKKAAGKALSIAICDPAIDHDVRGDSRAYAIVSGVRRFLESFEAWEAIASEAQPILGMDITDSALEELVRPKLLDLDTSDVSDGAFAHMVPNRVLLAALVARVRASDIALFPANITSFERNGARVLARTDSQTLSARLLVGADGKKSRVRENAGISFYGWSYDQTGITATISHSLPHEGRAVQHFLPSGPFALLPLKGNRSSIVWSEQSTTANRLLRRDLEELKAQIDQRSGGVVGTILAVEDIAAFPLSLGIARTFTADRLALLGDAAHAMHPIAGQGLNYGLRGAAALAEAILDTARLGLDIGSTHTLEAYESSRRADVVQMLAATDGLIRLFSNDSNALRVARDAGLGIVNRLPWLKNRIVARASGSIGPSPQVFRS